MSRELVNLRNQVLWQFTRVDLREICEREELGVLDQIEPRRKKLHEATAIPARFHEIADAAKLEPEEPDVAKLLVVRKEAWIHGGGTQHGLRCHR